jgi:hypothetical protein
MADLATLQHWMQGHIVTDDLPGEAAEASRAFCARDVIRSSHGLAAEDRLRIYARGYVLRLLECLRADFPVLHALVGRQVFDLFATAYLTQYQSRSPTLYDLGAGFADYLEATRPAEGRGPGTLEAIPASLARLERAMSEINRAPGPETGRDDALPVPAVLLPGTRLRLPRSVRLLRLDFDFSEALAAAGRGERPAQPPAKDVRVAVARSHYRVHVHALDEARFAWLEALGVAAADLATALASAPEAAADILAWLPMAAKAGLVTAA